MCLTIFTLASFKPIMIRIAARQAIGILFSKPGIDITAINKKTPCATADNLVFAPAFTLAVVLTITDVIGNPPIRPAKIFPTPCAFNSAFALEYLFIGSILSPASRHNNVSILATAVMVAAVIHTAGFVNAEKSGKVNWPKNSLAEEAVGNCTKCSPAICTDGLTVLKISLMMIPATTTTSAPGKTLIFFKKETLLKATKM